MLAKSLFVSFTVTIIIVIAAISIDGSRVNARSAESFSKYSLSQQQTARAAGTGFCSFSVTPSVFNFQASGGDGQIFVRYSGCGAWSFQEFIPWVTITTTTSNSSGMLINFTVDPNPGIARQASWLIRDKTVIINQAADCRASISPMNATMVAAGGNGSYNVTILTTCTWSATSNVSWITTNSSGNGNGTVTFTVANNTGPARVGTITAAGQTFTVNQQALVCNFSLNPVSANFVAVGGNGSFNVTSTTGCSWNASSNANWITTVSSGNGNGVVNFSVTANTGAGRVGTITTAGQVFTINQVAGNAARHTLFDFDGDGRSDYSVFRPSVGSWYLNRSSAGFTGITFGISSDALAPSDFDGDGKTDIAVFRNGNWYILKSSNGTVLSQTFGVSGDLPRPGDYDGDGKADICVFRPATGVWYRLNSSNNQFIGVQFGGNGDVPVAADFNGDGLRDVAVFRPTTGTWYWINSANGVFRALQFGQQGDIPVPADYDGDRQDEPSVFRPTNGIWYKYNLSSGQVTSVQCGLTGDIPTPSDYDGDGKADISVFRSSNGTWYGYNSANNSFVAIQFGSNGDKPVPAAFMP